MHTKPGLTPHGVSGLKFFVAQSNATMYKSHPTRGEWIEIRQPVAMPSVRYRSHPTRGEWIEISSVLDGVKPLTRLTPHGVSGLKFFQKSIGRIPSWSHPTRGEWIEIFSSLVVLQFVPVSPHTG